MSVYTIPLGSVVDILDDCDIEKDEDIGYVVTLVTFDEEGSVIYQINGNSDWVFVADSLQILELPSEESMAVASELAGNDEDSDGEDDSQQSDDEELDGDFPDDPETDDD
jgi:hypothetical protein